MNAPARIDVPKRQLANESKIHMKHGRSISLKDITPRKRRKRRRIDIPEEVHDKQKTPIKAYDKQKAPKEVYDEQEVPIEAYIELETLKEVRNKEIATKEAHVPENYEIS